MVGQETRLGAEVAQRPEALARAVRVVLVLRAPYRGVLRELALVGQRRPEVPLSQQGPRRLWGRVSRLIQRRGTHGGSFTKTHIFS